MLIAEDVTEANINIVGDRILMLGEVHVRAIEEVREAVKEMKSAKAPGLDGFPVGC